MIKTPDIHTYAIGEDFITQLSENRTCLIISNLLIKLSFILSFTYYLLEKYSNTYYLLEKCSKAGACIVAKMDTLYFEEVHGPMGL